MKSLKWILTVIAALLVLLAIPALASADVAINSTNFPDANFRQYILDAEFDQNGDNVLSVAELNEVTTISCSNRNISDLSGIEHFHALQKLNCSDNSIQTLSMFGNTSLRDLRCSGNQMTYLYLGSSSLLSYLDCSDNNLTSLYFSVSQPNLYLLSCEKNSITYLDLDACPLIGMAYLNGSPTVYSGTAFVYFYAAKYLYVDQSVSVHCSVPLTEEYFPDGNFRQFILDKGFDADDDGMLSEEERQAVTEIICNEKGIASLEGVQYFTVLDRLSCSQNQLTELDISKNTALTTLECYLNSFTELDVSRNTNLTYLNCPGNGLTSLDLSHNTALKRLLCYSNELTELDLSHNTALYYLDCHRNHLTELDLSHNTALTKLDCSDNPLTGLDISRHTALHDLLCYSNQLTELDVSRNTALTRIGCYNNQLTELDVTKNTALTWLDCYSNQLTELDVSRNTALAILDCHSNQLTELDVSRNTALYRLECYSNQLTALDVSRNTALTLLECYGNQFTKLDLSGNATLIDTVENGTKTTGKDNYIGVNYDQYKTDDHTIRVDIGVTFRTEPTAFPSFSVLILPDSLRMVESEAFAQSGASAVVIPPSVKSIASDAFSAGIIIYGCPDSAAQSWASAHGAYFIPVNTAWIEALRKIH